MKRKKRMIRVVPATELKNQAGAVMRRVEAGELQIVTRAGMPIGAIISMEDLERLYPERLTADLKRQRAWQRLLAALDETQRGGEQFSEAEVEADVQRAVDEVRRDKRRR